MATAAQRIDSTLAPHARRLDAARIADLVTADTGRPRDFALRVGGLYASFARQRYDRDARDALVALGDAAGLRQAVRALFDGVTVNTSEGRPALHVALRSALSQAPIARDAHAQAARARTRMAELVAALEASDVTDIVNVGIGGSDLGPRLVVDALKDFGTGRFRVHFLTNVDGSDAQHLLKGLDPARTAAILVSKTFSTQETLLNGAVVRDWLGGSERLYAVSANVPRAEAFGVAPERVLPMWDWVGGRYSLWSAVGFSIALAVGMAGFEALLAGAADMDAHVLEAPLAQNLPVLHALTAIWNRNALGLSTHAVLPYDERLALLPAYLQQLVMESLGKSVTPDGDDVGIETVPVLWGGPGTNSQHSFFQALHQGTQAVPADFIGVVSPAHPYVENHAALLSNLLAQTEALANGYAAEDPQKSYPGNRPSTLLLLDRLAPRSLGALIALYEHSVYAQSVLWGINAFDQWGVELGKRIAGELLPAVRGDGVAVDDPVTGALLDEIRARAARG
ncbi:glucose-6-phosphate isomerase [Luteimonas sp BLCC-B24]|uniref:glucose-6-phosphate isomerase n=1 Tax=Luteimonas sp. BLCC-B24 TaxID=3025317 RepID=UPI00234CAF3E|nr:glucose-6-phosphate isomerase [Luteimonas sp. BLCC-B24]MDC7805785.1 glucose-6-phosphate isomerase [Luteimonas sp. BLCC-B24]